MTPVWDAEEIDPESEMFFCISFADIFLSGIDSSSEISGAICKTQSGEVAVGKFRLLLEADDFKVVSHVTMPSWSTCDISKVSCSHLGGGFKHCLFSVLGEMTQFD